MRGASSVSQPAGGRSILAPQGSQEHVPISHAETHREPLATSYSATAVTWVVNAYIVAFGGLLLSDRAVARPGPMIPRTSRRSVGRCSSLTRGLISKVCRDLGPAGRPGNPPASGVESRAGAREIRRGFEH